LNAALVQKLDELAGDLFLGEFFGEAGSDKAAKDKGYYGRRQRSDRPANAPARF